MKRRLLSRSSFRDGLWESSLIETFISILVYDNSAWQGGKLTVAETNSELRGAETGGIGKVWQKVSARQTGVSGRCSTLQITPRFPDTVEQGYEQGDVAPQFFEHCEVLPAHG